MTLLKHVRFKLYHTRTPSKQNTLGNRMTLTTYSGLSTDINQRHVGGKNCQKLAVSIFKS